MNIWIGEVIGKMHIHNITQKQLAEYVGVRRDYLNKILNGKKEPKGMRERIQTALNTIIGQR